MYQHDPRRHTHAHLPSTSPVTVPIHHGTFHLGDDGEDEPIEVLMAALEKGQDLAPQFWVMANREGRDVPAMTLESA